MRHRREINKGNVWNTISEQLAGPGKQQEPPQAAASKVDEPPAPDIREGRNGIRIRKAVRPS
jgi:hypothetical protein